MRHSDRRFSEATRESTQTRGEKSAAPRGKSRVKPPAPPVSRDATGIRHFMPVMSEDYRSDLDPSGRLLWSFVCTSFLKRCTHPNDGG